MPRILVIDDEEAVRDVIELMLAMAGHEVTKAGSAREALQQLSRDAAYDLLLTDIFMPDVDGLDLLRQVRKRYPALRVMAISGGGSSGTMDVLTKARALGADPVLRKPFAARELRAAVETALAQEQPGAEG